jgi:protein phosphatase
MKFRACSLPGPKGENQDAVLAPFRLGNCFCCALADGVGSSRLGGLAAQSSIEVVRLSNPNQSNSEIFAAVHERLSEIASKKDKPSSISTTLSVLRICGNQAFVGHVGDTRISHYRGAGVLSRTKDQTEVQKLLDEGVLTKNQAARYPRRHVLLSAMSAGRGYDLYEQQFLVKKGDRLLLTTDGFHEKVKRRTVADISSSHSDFDDFWGAIERQLMSEKLEDDASCIAIEID